MTQADRTRLDRMIEEALSAEDRRILEATEELGWLQLGLQQFRGKLGWVTWVIMISQIAMVLGAVWCGVRFYGATEVVPALKWGLTGAVLIVLATQLKMALMPQMQADRLLRELKRLELLLVKGRK